MVRLAIIEVDSLQLDLYNAFLQEEIDASIKIEPGVITLYGVAEKEHPQRVTLFETYADSMQYRAHLTTPHFQKYKVGTAQMVKHLELIETNSILYNRKAELSEANSKELVIRMAKFELNPEQINNYLKLVKNVMLPGIQKEPGVLMMYAVAEKKSPHLITVLEVYRDKAALVMHAKMPHFIDYKRKSEAMVKSLKLTEMNQVLLGSKPQ